MEPRQVEVAESTCCNKETPAQAVQLRGAPAEAVAEVKWFGEVHEG